MHIAVENRQDAVLQGMSHVTCKCGLSSSHPPQVQASIPRMTCVAQDVVFGIGCYVNLVECIEEIQKPIY